MLENFLDKMKKHPEFLNYFVKHYLHRKEKWALCYRPADIVDTSGHVEGFHRHIKTNGMKGKCFYTLQA